MDRHKEWKKLPITNLGGLISWRFDKVVTIVPMRKTVSAFTEEVKWAEDNYPDKKDWDDPEVIAQFLLTFPHRTGWPT